jgi:hypothetical protein
MGTYGRGVLLDKESDNGVNAPGGQPLPPGPYTREAGYWGYNEVIISSSYIINEEVEKLSPMLSHKLFL